MYRCLFYIFMLIVSTSCGVNPVTGRRQLSVISETTELRIGNEQYHVMQQAQGGVYSAAPQLNDYVENIGRKMALVSDRPNLPYEFVLLNNSVPNAWALPGGKIAINRGLLLELDNEAELAAVLGHEVVHAAAGHSVSRMQQGIFLQAALGGINGMLAGNNHCEIVGQASALGAQLLTKQYSQHHELEADNYGMRYMARAGYDPYAAVTLQKTFLRLQKEERNHWLVGLFATHPPSKKRIRANKKTAGRLVENSHYLGKRKYQAAIAHLVKAKKAYEWHKRAKEKLEKGEVRQAQDLLASAIKLEPNEGLFYHLKGDIAAYSRKDDDAAIDAYDLAIQKGEDYFLYYLSRGLVKQRSGDLFEAQKDLEMSIHLLPTAAAHYALGELYFRKGMVDEAIEYYQVAAQADSKDGKLSRLRLIEIDLPKNPENYMNVTFSRDRRNFLIVGLRNKSPLNLDRVELQVHYNEALADGTYAVGYRDVIFSKKINTQQIAMQSVDLGPFPKQGNLNTILHVEVMKVLVAK